jgi:hypothetical protein
MDKSNWDLSILTSNTHPTVIQARQMVTPPHFYGTLGNEKKVYFN